MAATHESLVPVHFTTTASDSCAFSKVEQVTGKIWTQPDSEILTSTGSSISDTTIESTWPPATGQSSSYREEEESDRLFDLATLILEECKAAASLSDLDTAIGLFEEILARCPLPNPLRSDSLKDLAGALLTRFSLTTHPQDLEHALSRFIDLVNGHNMSKQLECGNNSTIDHDVIFAGRGTWWYDPELSHLSKLARTTLANVNQSARLSSLDTTIMLYREALLRRPSPHPKRLASLSGLSAALYAQFRRTDNTSSLDEAISLLRGEVMACPETDVYRGGLLRSLSAMLTTKFHKTGQNMDLEEGVTRYVEVLQLASTLLNSSSDLLQQFEQSGRMVDLETAILLLRECKVLLYSEHLNWFVVLGNLAGAVHTRFRQSGESEDLNESISLNQQILELVAAPHPGRSNALNNLGLALKSRFRKSGQRQDLEEAISFHQEALKLCLHRDRSHPLNNLALALRTRFDHSGRRRDLDEAISLHREALKLCAAPHPDRFVSLDHLASALKTQFGQSGQLEDLDEAISFHREAVKLCPASHLRHDGLLDRLALALRARFDQSGQHNDLNETISFHREILELRAAPHPLRADLLDTLGEALRKQFDYSGQRRDLDEEISFHREALNLRAAPHPDRFVLLDHLALALETQFGQSDECEDLNEAISFRQEALRLCPAPHPSQAHLLNNLAIALRMRFDRSGQREDINKAISFNRESLELYPAPHPNRSCSLINLANDLSGLFGLSGQREDLNEAISFHKKAFELCPAPHPLRWRSLEGLGVVLKAQFDRSGQRRDLDDAILFYREALELCPAPHPHRFISLNNLSGSLLTRFCHSRQRGDLNEAISFNRKALELCPARHPQRAAVLINLANDLKQLFKLSGQQGDQNEAISFHRQALELRAAPHPHRSRALHNLGSALMNQVNEPGQLNEIISIHREALKLRAAPHPDRFLSLNSLAFALETQFNQSGEQVYLDEAITIYNESLDVLARGHPAILMVSVNLGRALMKTYSHTCETVHLHKAMAAFRAGCACEAASASDRFNAAKSWAYGADEFNHESALDAYEVSIGLLPRLAMLGLDLQSRQQALTSGSDGLARDAAACAIRSGQYGKAVELLEAGRGVFWSQALQLHTPMTDLCEVAPELANNLKNISRALEQGSHRDASRHPSNTPQTVMSMEKEASHFNRLNDDWLATLEKVRHLDGFQDFLHPSRLSKLQGATANGPVVFFNASKTGCAGLILTSSGVQHVPFPDLDLTQVIVLNELIQHGIAHSGRDTLLSESNRLHTESLLCRMPILSDVSQRLRMPFEGRHMSRYSTPPVKSDDFFRYVLAVLWESAVEPIIRLLQLKVTDEPPNLRWCPTGPFAFLPIHAAGIYIPEGTVCVSDYVVSSYTPTISSLLRDVPVSTSAFKMMAVIQPDTYGQQPLPYTLDELRKIESHIPGEHLVKLVRCSVKEAISHLPAVSVAHFACHGKQNTQNPLESALLLQDDQLTVSQIMQHAMPNASLAFLSACETAVGDKNLPDEVIHLGASLLFAGFRGVVATMWTIVDADGPKIADSFYENLFKYSSTPMDISRLEAARALHLAVTKLRSENVSFARWVPFIHLGC